MQLINLKRLKTLMVVQEVSQRELATAAGYKSHAYMGRLLRGEVDTLDKDAALRVALYLGVGVDDLFVLRSSSGSRQTAKRKVAA